MQRFREESQGGRLERPWDTCLDGGQSTRRSDYDRNFFSFLSALLVGPLNMWRQLSTSNEHYIPLDQDTSILFENLQNLIRTTEETSKSLSPKIGVAVPEWLTDAQACKLITTISNTGRSVQLLEHAPAAAFSAFGYDLCRVDSEWLPCSPPGRIMTLEYSTSALTASLLTTPLLYWMEGKLSYSIKEDLAIDLATETAGIASREREMIEWINDFESTHGPDKVILLGPRTESPVFKKTVEASSISTLVVTNPDIPPEHAVVLGIARMTKDFLESQGEDCIEDEVCLEIRRKADRLAEAHASTDEANDAEHVEL